MLKDANDWNNLVIGPWTHGGWTFHTGDSMLEFDFGSETGRYYKKEIRLASATATSFFGLRASIPASHGSVVSSRRLAC